MREWESVGGVRRAVRRAVGALRREVVVEDVLEAAQLAVGGVPEGDHLLVEDFEDVEVGRQRRERLRGGGGCGAGLRCRAAEEPAACHRRRRGAEETAAGRRRGLRGAKEPAARHGRGRCAEEPAAAGGLRCRVRPRPAQKRRPRPGAWSVGMAPRQRAGRRPARVRRLLRDGGAPKAAARGQPTAAEEEERPPARRSRTPCARRRSAHGAVQPAGRCFAIGCRAPPPARANIDEELRILARGARIGVRNVREEGARRRSLPLGIRRRLGDVQLDRARAPTARAGSGSSRVGLSVAAPRARTPCSPTT